eukprot:CAMPEP_0202910670 /NCGR_PEP_ID=MMETSP1392-20130828/52672_1 /ASSEMBLY_ACC=CAM_ASM_000868 /TAXON_ID=225041 /ORGANISM="Chlamydomonas chlamydogama, Strain SAG 11-48b" /LENGTH=197 /DNA_ID=CAMNT_0049600841 /DNA_START=85 /DNA_END=675 /DNA_ORIENTATION=-
MTDFGRRGVELLKEIVNCDYDNVSPYNEELIRLVLNEVQEHHHQTQKILSEQLSDRDGVVSTQQWQDNMAAAVSLTVHLQSISRNKKLLLSYMMLRSSRLQHVRWSHRTLPAHVASNCSPQEVEVYRAYDRLLSKYMSKSEGIGLDLTLDTRPPKDISIEVKVVKEAGEMLFSFGRACLIPGLLLYLPADEAEPLIK